MKTCLTKKKSLYITLLTLVSLLYILFSYILFFPSVGLLSLSEYSGGMYFLVNTLLIVLVGTFLFKKKKLTTKNILVLMFIFSVIIHMFYIFYTDAYTRQHDTVTSGTITDVGHFGYAYAFYLTNKLPAYAISVNNIYQFYHPPLNAFLQGHFMQIFKFINPNSSLESNPLVLYASTQLLSLIYIFVSSLFMVKTLKLIKIKKKYFLLAASFLIFFPRLTELSGQLNNDTLCFMFQTIAIYFSFKWYLKGKARKDILMIALFIGLSMFTKMSGSIIAVGIGFIFITEFIRSILKKDGSRPLKSLIIDYLMFILICFPLALVWQVYLNKAYSIPYNFVFSRLTSKLFVGTSDYVLNKLPESIDYYNSNNSGIIYTNNFYNTVVRFIFPFYTPDLLDNVFCNSFNNYNLLTFALKSSIFGEWRYGSNVLVNSIAMLSTILIFINYFIFLIHTVICFIKCRSKEFYLSFSLFIGIVIMFIYLQVRMPYGCSMDFRYIIPIILPIIFIDVLSLSRKSKKSLKNDILEFTTVFSLIAFLVLSVAFYIIII